MINNQSILESRLSETGETKDICSNSPSDLPEHLQQVGVDATNVALLEVPAVNAWGSAPGSALKQQLFAPLLIPSSSSGREAFFLLW